MEYKEEKVGKKVSEEIGWQIKKKAKLFAYFSLKYHKVFTSFWPSFGEKKRLWKLHFRARGKGVAVNSKYADVLLGSSNVYCSFRFYSILSTYPRFYLSMEPTLYLPISGLDLLHIPIVHGLCMYTKIIYVHLTVYIYIYIWNIHIYTFICMHAVSPYFCVTHIIVSLVKSDA